MTIQRSPLIIIFLTVFIDMLGVGIVLPLLPFYVKLLEGASVPWLAPNVALIIGGMTAAYSLFQFLFTPVLGGLSDRFGRRPILLTSLVGTGLAYLLFGTAELLLPLGAGVVLAMLFFARVVAGVSGASIATAQTYIADVTPPEERARGLGMIGAAFGLGFMLGPALGGLLSQISLSTPAYVAAALSLANAAFGFVKLPESLPPEQRSELAERTLNPFARLSKVVGKTAIRPLLVGSLLLNFAFAGLQSNFAVFSNARFGFGPQDNAWIFAFIGLIAVIVQGGLIRQLVARFGEARLAVAGLGLMTASFLMIALAPQAWVLYPAVGLLAAGSGMATPSLTSLISRRVAVREQGAVLGGVQAFTSLMMVVGPLFAGLLFDELGPAAPYIAGTLLVAAAGGVIATALRPDLTRPAPLGQPAPVALNVEEPAAQSR